MQSYIRTIDQVSGDATVITDLCLTAMLPIALAHKGQWCIRLHNGILVFSHFTNDKEQDDSPWSVRVWNVLRSMRLRLK